MKKNEYSPVEASDRYALSLGRQYQAAAGGLGAGTGALSTLNPIAAVAAMTVELPSLLALQARTIQGIAASYGYDPRAPHEKKTARPLLQKV